MATYQFEEGKECDRRREGKPEWQDVIRFELSRRAAYELIIDLSRQLQRKDGDVYVMLMGELSLVEDEAGGSKAPKGHEPGYLP